MSDDILRRTFTYSGRKLEIRATHSDKGWNIAVFDHDRKVSRDYLVSHAGKNGTLVGSLSVNLVDHIMQVIEHQIMLRHEPLLA